MSGGYRCIASDPPWPEYGGGGRGAQNHYGLMSVPDIRKLMLRELTGKVAPSAHLRLWVTDNYFEAGLDIMRALGFAYKRTFVWVKLDEGSYSADEWRGVHPIEVANDALQIGLGQYARGAHEICLFGTCGQAMVPDPENRPPSVFFAPREEHSRKPAGFYSERIEKVSPGPRLEMFARSPRAGWDVWGLETNKFPAVSG